MRIIRCLDNNEASVTDFKINPIDTTLIDKILQPASLEGFQLSEKTKQLDPAGSIPQKNLKDRWQEMEGKNENKRKAPILSLESIEVVNLKKLDKEKITDLMLTQTRLEEKEITKKNTKARKTKKKR